jgi:hypothetical protein
MRDIVEDALTLDSGEHKIWQVNRGLLSPLYLPEPSVLLNLPPGRPRWHQFSFTLQAQQTQNLTVVFGPRAWVLAIIKGHGAGLPFFVSLYDAGHKRSLQTGRETANNIGGLPSTPAWLSTPWELAPNAPLFCRVTNGLKSVLSSSLILYSHLEGE